MSEILSNTGVKLWAETDYSELWLTVFDQLTGQGGKSNIRLIDEAIGKINATLDGYKFEFSSDEDRLYISKGDSKLPVSLIDSKGHVASKVDGTTITIDESGVVKGIPVDDALSEESTNPLQNKVIAGELKSIKSKMGTDESAIKQNTSNITSNTKRIEANESAIKQNTSNITNNTKRIEANETAISTLNGTGNGSVKKAVSDGIAEVVAGAPEDFDTLKEMSDWISTHETSASAMNSQIQDNKKAIDNHTLNGDVHVTPENKTNWNKVFEKLDKTGDASNVITEFTTATTRSNLTTKEKLSISFGKISKWFSDLKTVAFSGSYNDLSNKPASLPASDVSAWAKASTKPTYTKAEVGLGNVNNTADANKSVKYATSSGNATKVNNHTVNADVPSGAKFTDTTYGVATTSSSGLMTTTMVSKLNGIAEGANKTTIDTALSSTSTNPVQNKVVNAAIVKKADTISYDKSASTLYLKSGSTVLSSTVIKSVVGAELKIVTFANGTDEEILDMIEAHYANKINIADYWAVGDTRSVSLSAMSATGVGESHRAQTVQLVILGFEHDDLATAINGHSKAAVSVGLKDCLMDATSANNSNNGSNDTEKGYMNSSATNAGGWKGCARRTWCNNVYFGALPTAWQSMIKTVNKKVSVGNNSSTIETVQDKIFLAAEIEIFGSTTYSFAGEGTQYQYYKNATANRYKMPKWGSSYVSNIYWERSPFSGNTSTFCIVNDNGNAYTSPAHFALGVAPCLCI